MATFDISAMGGLRKFLSFVNIRPGRFSLVEYCQSFENVCLYGTGQFFKDVFVYHDFKKRFHVKYISDSREERIDELKDAVSNSAFSGVNFIYPSDISSISNVLVITMFRDDWALRKALTAQGIPVVGGFELALEMDVDTGFDGKADPEGFLEFYELLQDDYSREAFVNILANRLAPEFAVKPYSSFNIHMPYYFNDRSLLLSRHECFVDCGAYNGDTIRDFLKYSNGVFDSIYAFELEKGNYDALNSYMNSLNCSEKMALRA